MLSIKMFMLSSLSIAVIKHLDPGNFRRIYLGLTVLGVSLPPSQQGSREQGGVARRAGS